MQKIMRESFLSNIQAPEKISRTDIRRSQELQTLVPTVKTVRHASADIDPNIEVTDTTYRTWFKVNPKYKDAKVLYDNTSRNFGRLQIAGTTLVLGTWVGVGLAKGLLLSTFGPIAFTVASGAVLTGVAILAAATLARVLHAATMYPSPGNHLGHSIIKQETVKKVE